MTLPEALKNYRIKYHLSYEAMATRVGVSHATIRNVERLERYTQMAAKKIADALGYEFEKYLEHSVCANCGSIFYAQKYDQACCSKTCNLDDLKKNPNSLRSRVTKEKKQKRCVKGTNPNHEHAQFNQEARNQGKSYGDRQSEFRLKTATIG